MNKLEMLRKDIDECDNAITSAYVERLKLVEQVASYKKDSNVEVLSSNRETEILNRLMENSGEYKNDVKYLYQYIMKYSREKQSELIK